MMPVKTTMAPIITTPTVVKPVDLSKYLTATGIYTMYISGTYGIVIFTGNGTVKFNQSLDNLSILAVAGGGGGSGGGSEEYPFDDGEMVYGGNGGVGGANIIGYMSSILSKTTLTIKVGGGGSGGINYRNGGMGGDTTVSNGTTNYITCKGGVGGLYKSISATEPSSSYYTINSTVVTSVQSGGVIANTKYQGGSSGVGSFYDTRQGTSSNEKNGNNSFTLSKKFTVPTNVSQYVQTAYSGGGGGGGRTNGGKAGKNGYGGSGGSNNSTVGETATAYGGGGGGGSSANRGSTGGAGAQGVVVIYFNAKFS